MDVLDVEYSEYFLEKLIYFPGSRVIFGELTSFLISMDRYQLYAFHNRNYSNYSSTFINRTSEMLSKKGILSKTIINMIFPNLVQISEQMISSFSYKKEYINPKAIRKPSTGFGFISNNSSLILYSIPFYIIFSLCLYIIFRLTFNYKFSVLLRKYCFGGTILLMLCEGNLEQYSFYCFG